MAVGGKDRFSCCLSGGFKSSSFSGFFIRVGIILGKKVLVALVSFSEKATNAFCRMKLWNESSIQIKVTG